jgi:hypothetical protein
MIKIQSAKHSFSLHIFNQMLIDSNFYCVNLMRNSYYISPKSVPITSHNFDTINISTSIHNINKFKGWKTCRRRSSTLEINNP